MKTVIITGSTSGIGIELVKQLNKSINQIICCYRSEEKFAENFSKFSVDGFNTTKREIDGICELINKETEEIILLLTAFSIAPIKRIGNYTNNEIDNFIHINIKFNFQIINFLIQFCKENNKLIRIINFDSGASDFSLKGWSWYCASKSFINSILRNVKDENHESKIVSFDPGVVDTKMQSLIRKSDKAVFDKVSDFINYKKVGLLNTPGEIANYVIKNYIDNWNAKADREKYEK